MHEAGIVERILDVVVEQAADSGAARVVSVQLEAGALARVSEASLRFHWERLAAGTAAEGAELHLVETDEPSDLRLVSIDVEDAVDDTATP